VLVVGSMGPYNVTDLTTRLFAGRYRSRCIWDCQLGDVFSYWQADLLCLEYHFRLLFIDSAHDELSDPLRGNQETHPFAKAET
jgi:hypothetical protein